MSSMYYVIYCVFFSFTSHDWQEITLFTQIQTAKYPDSYNISSFFFEYSVTMNQMILHHLRRKMKYM